VTPELLSPLAVLAPLGISPFLALGLIGMATRFANLSLPPGLGILQFAPVWMALLALAILLKMGRSFKLTKPFAETFGTTESLVALLALATMLLAPDASVPAQVVVGFGDVLPPLTAGVASTALLVATALTGLVAIIVVRMGFDLLTWLSPIPFIDALLQFIKLVVTAVFVAVAIFLPGLAVPLNIVALIAALIAGRWLYRLARFAARVIWDGVAGRLWPSALERGDDGRVGPMRAFVLSGSGLPWLGPIDVWWAGGDWLAARTFDLEEPWKVLGSSAECRLDRGFAGTILRAPDARLFLTPRFHAALPWLAKETGTSINRRLWLDNPTLEIRTIPPR
jgi:hypothetical protein